MLCKVIAPHANFGADFKRRQYRSLDRYSSYSSTNLIYIVDQTANQIFNPSLRPNHLRRSFRSGLSNFPPTGEILSSNIVLSSACPHPFEQKNVEATSHYFIKNYFGRDSPCTTSVHIPTLGRKRADHSRSPDRLVAWVCNAELYGYYSTPLSRCSVVPKHRKYIIQPSTRTDSTSICKLRFQVHKMRCWISSLVAFVASWGVLNASGAEFPDRKSFLKEIDASTWVIGNDLWNVTQGRQYAKKLYYQGKDLVGDAWGHYVSYSMYLLISEFSYWLLLH